MNYEENSVDKILEARDNHFSLVEELVKENDDILIIQIKANTPGIDKNISRSYFLVDYFYNLLKEKFRHQIIETHYYESADGPFYFLLLRNANDDNGCLHKEMLIEMEDQHGMGRLIDLDIFFNSPISISRFSLGKKLRKCFICDNDAHVCSRSKEHNIDEINHEIGKIFNTYFNNLITTLLDTSIMAELDLDPKFGLVTPFTNGSHQDMNYQMMKNSKDVIIPHLLKSFELGYHHDLEEAFSLARVEGLRAEASMYEVTKGVNTYKGLIFLLSSVLLAIGSSLKDYQHNNFQEQFYLNIVKIGDLLKRDFTNTLPNSVVSNGLRLFRKYQVLGARGEIINGLQTVRDVLPKINDYGKETLTMLLIYFITNTTDTVLLTRAQTMEKFQYYQNVVAEIKEYDNDLIKQVSDEFIKEKLSVGGAADLLIVTIFLKKFFGEVTNLNN